VPLPPLVRVALLVYDVLLELVVWLALAPVEAVRALAGRSSVDQLAERLGRLPAAPGGLPAKQGGTLPAARVAGDARHDQRRPREALLLAAQPASRSTGRSDGHGAPAGAIRRVLVHAVSVGELAAAEALLAEGSRPGGWLRPSDGSGEVRVWLTTGTREGLSSARTLARRHPAVEWVGLLPWDRRRVLRRLLATLRPAVVMVVETELWPGLLAVARELGIPVELASARIPPHEVRRYRLARWLFAPLLAGVAGIGAQSAGERARLIAIGAPAERVRVDGNLKADRLAVVRSRPPRAGAPVVLGASTHAADERRLLDACSRLRAAGFEHVLVLAPRHPRRAPTVARRAVELGATRLGRDLDDDVAATPSLLVVDRLGALDALYERADVVVVGGSFGRHGGHDPLAPASRGCPVVIGPRYRHVEEAVEALRNAGGLTVARDAGELARELERLLRDEGAQRAMGAAGAAAVVAMQGAARRTGERLALHLQPARGSASGSRGVETRVAPPPRSRAR
jgi:3-deoxy-D-manno-octulosonic-acid transferase